MKTFVNTHGRFPKQTSETESEKKLAWCMTHVKRKERGYRGARPLSTAERATLLEVPGWTSNRWERSENTGTRKARKGWEARIQVGDTTYYGPPRKTRELAREDYVSLRELADQSTKAFSDGLADLLQKVKAC